MSGGRRRLHTAFLFVTSLVGWVAVVSASHAIVLPRAGELGAAALFFAVVAGARALAFPLPGVGGVETSLDSAIFIAAAVCLGPAGTATAVALVLALDGLRRARLQYALSVSGVAGALLYGCARLYAVDQVPHDLWRTIAFGATFLVAHYGLQAFGQWLGGGSWRTVARRNGFSVLAEAALLPLASTLVLIYDPTRLVAVALLGATYLLVNFGFQRLAKLAAALRRRVAELETLNRTAHALGTTLEAPSLLTALLREMARALPMAERIDAVIAVDAEDAADHEAGLVRYRLQHGELTVEPADAAASAAVAMAAARLEDDLPGQGTDGVEVRARMTVPLMMYGETTGALVAEASEPGAFGRDELRLFDAIGGQAAAAVENARLYALANVDGLTGLYVRRYFDLRVSEEVERARRFGTTFSLVMLDLDDFKRINDTHGHIVGDRALRQVAALAAAQLRGVDLAARYGGEELAFLLPRTALPDAHAVAERIRAAVSAHDFGGLHITASLGVAGWIEAGTDDPEQLIAHADAALYRAKASGKDRVDVALGTRGRKPLVAPPRTATTERSRS